jgi:hypothetical protein
LSKKLNDHILSFSNTQKQVLDHILNNENLSQFEREEMIMKMLNDGKLDSKVRNELYKRILKDPGMLPPEERKKVLKEMLSNLKNLDRLNASRFNLLKLLIILYSSDAQKELLKQLLENPDLTPEERETLLKQLYENMDNLDPTVRKELMKKLIKNPNLLPPKEREKLMKEMIKNMGDLDETTKADLMRQILEK